MIGIAHAVPDSGAGKALQAAVLLAALAVVCLTMIVIGWLVMDTLHEGMRYTVEEPWSAHEHFSSTL